ncbi:MAG: hypothetical protein CSB55_01545 [Candidatus Cloacimonadota bacterium]|nr:MAG: hypothetical protein CSB55_01545 [Candidatus Cloacimonadota bacterium]
MSTVTPLSEMPPAERIKKDPFHIDPYDVLSAHIDAIGGEKALKSDRNMHAKGTVLLNGTSYEFEEFAEYPGKSRITYYFEGEEYFQKGDDGKQLWQSQNRETRKFPDANSKSRKIREGMKSYEFADKKSETFKVSFESVSYEKGEKVYNIRIKNNLTNEEFLNSYSADSFLLLKEDRKFSGENIVTYFDNYQNVNGKMTAFKKNVNNLTSKKTQDYVYETYKRNVTIEKSLFDPPEYELSIFNQVSKAAAENQ